MLAVAVRVGILLLVLQALPIRAVVAAVAVVLALTMLVVTGVQALLSFRM